MEALLKYSKVYNAQRQLTYVFIQSAQREDPFF